MKNDDERANRTFSLFLIAMMIALIKGFAIGCMITLTFYK